jgi:small multidrug resistance pump
MAWMLLGVAIVSEVGATLALRASRGLTVLAPSVAVAVGYTIAFVLLAQALKGIGVGPAYATWSGLGTVGAAVGATVFFGERLTAWGVVGMALVIVGVLVMNLAGGVSHG